MIVFLPPTHKLLYNSCWTVPAVAISLKVWCCVLQDQKKVVWIKQLSEGCKSNNRHCITPPPPPPPLGWNAENAGWNFILDRFSFRLPSELSSIKRNGCSSHPVSGPAAGCPPEQITGKFNTNYNNFLKKKNLVDFAALDIVMFSFSVADPHPVDS